MSLVRHDLILLSGVRSPKDASKEVREVNKSPLLRWRLFYRIHVFDYKLSGEVNVYFWQRCRANLEEAASWQTSTLQLLLMNLLHHFHILITVFWPFSTKANQVLVLVPDRCVASLGHCTFHQFTSIADKILVDYIDSLQVLLLVLHAFITVPDHRCFLCLSSCGSVRTSYSRSGC